MNQPFLVLVIVTIIAFLPAPMLGSERADEISPPWKRPEKLFILNPQTSAFVIIDMQNFSCAPEEGSPPPQIEKVARRINQLADFCREAGIPVVWVRQNMTASAKTNDAGLYPLFHDPRRTKNIMNLGKGTEIFPAMHRDQARDHVVFKNRYSAFLSTPPGLREKIDGLKRKQLIFAGIAVNVCVESTIRDAMQLDYEVVLVSDGVTGPDATLLQSTLKNTHLFFGDVRTTDDIIRELKNNFPSSRRLGRPHWQIKP
jgi:ureidoacrylate peracid hydrolase